MEENSITFDTQANADRSEMLRITSEGFYVRGVRVPADEQEAATVYNAFKEWMVWSQMTREY